MMTYTADQAKKDSKACFNQPITNAEKAAKNFVDDYIVPKIKLAAAGGIGRIKLPQNYEGDVVSMKYWWPVSGGVIKNAADTGLFQNTVWQILKDAGYEVREFSGSLVINWF